MSPDSSGATLLCGRKCRIVGVDSMSLAVGIDNINEFPESAWNQIKRR